VFVLWTLRPAAGAEILAGELGQKLNAQMSKHAADGFSGVVLIARNGEVAISKGYGHADLKRKLPFTSETVFDIGSITKQFTAAAIVRLEMDGKLKVEDKITKFFGDVPADKREITLHHLLTHGSGLFLQLGDDYEIAPRDQVVRTMLDMRVSAPPGERHKYSNGGYSLLGAVVEIASGQPYETYLREKLFLPAGMEHTGYRLPDWSKVVVAREVNRAGDDWGTPLDHPWADDGPYWNLRANGGILSTVGDLYRWHLALVSNRILSKEARDKMFAQHMREAPFSRSYYGYGWSIATTVRGTRLIAHNGGNGIFFANFRRYVDDDVVVIVASNDARHSAENIEGGLLAIVFGKPSGN
jgi:CubicO group peptidase (beta-lactamase class C family)